MKVSVRVPASTANLGPGFDCLGMALPIYNTITIEETVLPGTGVEINVISESEAIDEVSIEHMELNENSLIYKAVELLYNSIGQTPAELKINVHSNIPIARGLGSSAAVIVGGLVAANELLGRPADEAALLSIAAEVEGHPDNVTPAIVGGCVIASIEDDCAVTYRKLNWPEEWVISLCIPDYELPTEIARSVLPECVPIKDAVFNIKRVAMLIEALNTKDKELMKLALQDKIHQPYRAKLVPGLEKIIQNMRHEEDILGCVLSGAGPTVLVISTKDAVNKVETIVKNCWEDANIKGDIKTVKVENNGATIVTNED